MELEGPNIALLRAFQFEKFEKYAFWNSIAFLISARGLGANDFGLVFKQILFLPTLFFQDVPSSQDQQKQKTVQRCSRSKSCYNDPIYLSKHSIVCKENFFKYWCMKNLLNEKNVDSPSVFKLAACFSKVSESPISVSKYDNLMIHFAYPALSSRSCNLKRSWGLRIEKSP